MSGLSTVRMVPYLSVCTYNLSAHRYSPVLTASGSPSRYADGLQAPCREIYCIVGQTSIVLLNLMELNPSAITTKSCTILVQP